MILDENAYELILDLYKGAPKIWYRNVQGPHNEKSSPGPPRV